MLISDILILRDQGPTWLSSVWKTLADAVENSYISHSYCSIHKPTQLKFNQRKTTQNSLENFEAWSSHLTFLSAVPNSFQD